MKDYGTQFKQLTTTEQEKKLTTIPENAEMMMISSDCALTQTFVNSIHTTENDLITLKQNIDQINGYITSNGTNEQVQDLLQSQQELQERYQDYLSGANYLLLDCMLHYLIHPEVTNENLSFARELVQKKASIFLEKVDQGDKIEGNFITPYVTTKTIATARSIRIGLTEASTTNQIGMISNLRDHVTDSKLQWFNQSKEPKTIVFDRPLDLALQMQSLKEYHPSIEKLNIKLIPSIHRGAK